MGIPEIRALGIVQDGFTMHWKARGEVEGIGWLEAWESSLVEAMEALQALAAQRIAEQAAEVQPGDIPSRRSPP
jgi:hypothetical protein